MKTTMTNKDKDSHYFQLHIDDDETENTHNKSTQIESEKELNSLSLSDKPFVEPAPEPEEFSNVQNSKPQIDVQPAQLPITNEKYQQKEVKSSNKNDTSQAVGSSKWKDTLYSISYSLFFFITGFIILNWSAISQRANHFYRELTGQNKNTPLTQLVDDLPGEQGVSRGESDAIDAVPDLDLELAPLEDRIIIPRISQNIPIVRISTDSLIKRDWTALENEMQDALQNGVVHYPGTSLPGQHGNVVVTGHSSYFPWDPGRFKDVFALLHDVEVGDKVVIYYKQQKYIYEIDEIEVVTPDDIDVLKQTPEDTLTLITCTPVGTNLKRLIVKAKPIAKNLQSL